MVHSEHSEANRKELDTHQNLLTPCSAVKVNISIEIIVTMKHC